MAPTDDHKVKAAPVRPPLGRTGGKCVVLDGMGVARGIAIGPVYRHESDWVSVAEYHIAANGVAAEQDRFHQAVAKAAQQIEDLHEKAADLEGAAAEEMGYLLDAYRQMLHGSRLVRGVLGRISANQINAEAAVQHEIEQIAQGFEAMGDAYLASRVADIRDLGKRLLRNLTGTLYRPFQVLPKNAVIVADDLSPADTALLDPTRVAGIATVLGGAESHTAIMARSLGLPAVLGVGMLMAKAKTGDLAVIDGRKGRVVLNPSAEQLRVYRQDRADYLRGRRALARLRDVPAVTQDGTRIQLQANVELPGEVTAVLAQGAEGIGLLRSEFLYMNREDVPGEEEQFAILRTLVQRMDGRPVTIRTLDVGGDKLAHGLGISIGPNPALGLRAVRLSLSRTDLLDVQLSACLRASAFGPIRILVPMVATVEELRAVRQVMDQVAARLAAQGVPMAHPLPPLGVMIEIPGAALSADALAGLADFFAIGTNDLTQYTLAIDRSDEAVAHLYNPLHPAVLRLIQFSAEAALRARIPVSICGEIAGDPRYTALLLGLGIRDLSMSSTNLPVVKQRIRGLDMAAAGRLARSIMDQSDSPLIAQMLDRFNGDQPA